MNETHKLFLFALHYLRELHSSRGLADRFEVSMSTIEVWSQSQATPHAVVQRHVISSFIEEATGTEHA